MVISNCPEVAFQPSFREALDGGSCARARQAYPVAVLRSGRNQVRFFERVTGRTDALQRIPGLLLFTGLETSMGLQHEAVDHVRRDLAVLAEVHTLTAGIGGGLQEFPLPVPTQVVHALNAADPTFVRHFVVALKPYYWQPFLFHAGESTHARPKKGV